MDLVIVLAWTWLKQPAPSAPVPAPFWPETFVQWMQAAGPAVTAIALIVTMIGLWLNGRWRHRDYASERQNHASHVIAEVTRTRVGQESPASRIERATLHNTGSEVMKEPAFQIIDRSTGKPVQIAGSGGRVTDELVLSHLAPGGTKVWDNIFSDAIVDVEVDGEMRPNVGVRVKWTDAAGWRWQMDDNGVPKRLGR